MFLIGDRVKPWQKTDLVQFELENACDDKDFGKKIVIGL